MSSQRPNFFLSGFWAAFSRQTTTPSSLASAAAHTPNKPTSQATTAGPSSYGSSSTVARAVSSAAAAASSNSSNNNVATSPGVGPSSPSAAQTRSTGGVYSQFPSYHHHHHHHHHSPHTRTTTGPGIPIPRRPGSGRRRGSDSSSEGFRDVLGAEKLYIGGRTATGEEKFFRLGVVRRVRSGDRLSLDRLSL